MGVAREVLSSVSRLYGQYLDALRSPDRALAYRRCRDSLDEGVKVEMVKRALSDLAELVSRVEDGVSWSIAEGRAYAVARLRSDHEVSSKLSEMAGFVLDAEEYEGRVLKHRVIVESPCREDEGRATVLGALFSVFDGWARVRWIRVDLRGGCLCVKIVTDVEMEE